MKNPLPYEISKIGWYGISKIGWRGYTIQFSQYHIIIKSPEGYLRYELPRKYNTTQDAMEIITNYYEHGIEYFSLARMGSQYLGVINELL